MNIIEIWEQFRFTLISRINIPSELLIWLEKETICGAKKEQKSVKPKNNWKNKTHFIVFLLVHVLGERMSLKLYL